MCRQYFFPQSCQALWSVRHVVMSEAPTFANLNCKFEFSESWSCGLNNGCEIDFALPSKSQISWHFYLEAGGCSINSCLPGKPIQMPSCGKFVLIMELHMNEPSAKHISKCALLQSSTFSERVFLQDMPRPFPSGKAYLKQMYFPALGCPISFCGKAFECASGKTCVYGTAGGLLLTTI